MVSNGKRIIIAYGEEPSVDGHFHEYCCDFMMITAMTHQVEPLGRSAAPPVAPAAEFRSGASQRQRDVTPRQGVSSLELLPEPEDPGRAMVAGGWWWMVSKHG